jgi:hypothetical protein
MCEFISMFKGRGEQRAGGGVPDAAAEAGHLCWRLPGAAGAARGLVRRRHAPIQDERGVGGQLPHAQSRREDRSLKKLQDLLV